MRKKILRIAATVMLAFTAFQFSSTITTKAAIEVPSNTEITFTYICFIRRYENTTDELKDTYRKKGDYFRVSQINDIFFWDMGESLLETKNTYGDSQDSPLLDGNAFRHAYWSALAYCQNYSRTKSYNEMNNTSHLVEQYLPLRAICSHEVTSTSINSEGYKIATYANPTKDMLMDVYNNFVGKEIGKELVLKYGNSVELSVIKATVLDAVNKGLLIKVKPNTGDFTLEQDILPFSKQDDFDDYYIRTGNLGGIINDTPHVFG